MNEEKPKREVNQKPRSEKLDWWDKFRFSFYTGIGAAATQMAGVMANNQTVDITNTLILTTVLTFIVHYTATANKFIIEKIDRLKVK